MTGSRAIDINAVGTSGFVDKMGQYAFGVKIDPAPGYHTFSRTKVVTLFPRYVLYNRLGRPVELLPVEKGETRTPHALKPGEKADVVDEREVIFVDDGCTVLLHRFLGRRDEKTYGASSETDNTESNDEGLKRGHHLRLRLPPLVSLAAREAPSHAGQQRFRRQRSRRLKSDSSRGVERHCTQVPELRWSHGVNIGDDQARGRVWVGEEGYHLASLGPLPPPMAASQAFPECQYSSLPVVPLPM